MLNFMPPRRQRRPSPIPTHIAGGRLWPASLALRAPATPRHATPHHDSFPASPLAWPRWFGSAKHAGVAPRRPARAASEGLHTLPEVTPKMSVNCTYLRRSRPEKRHDRSLERFVTVTSFRGRVCTGQSWRDWQIPSWGGMKKNLGTMCHFVYLFSPDSIDYWTLLYVIYIWKGGATAAARISGSVPQRVL
jgi:hypothetical protein